MRLTGITNATLKFDFPMTVKLEETTCVGEREISDALWQGAATDDERSG
jgi:hypothetical protein